MTLSRQYEKRLRFVNLWEPQRHSLSIFSSQSWRRNYWRQFIVAGRYLWQFKN